MQVVYLFSSHPNFGHLLPCRRATAVSIGAGPALCVVRRFAMSGWRVEQVSLGGMLT